MNIYSYQTPPPGFYVYAYLREDGTPYYIGKGHERRAWKSRYPTRKPKEKRLIVVLECNLTELGALALERRYINWYGRIDNGTGILRNMTDGGEGTIGCTSPNKGKAFSEETRKKLSLSHLGKKIGPLSEDHKDKISKSKTGKKRAPFSEETKQKMREAQQARRSKDKKA